MVYNILALFFFGGGYFGGGHFGGGHFGGCHFGGGYFGGGHFGGGYFGGGIFSTYFWSAFFCKIIKFRVGYFVFLYSSNSLIFMGHPARFSKNLFDWIC